MSASFRPGLHPLSKTAVGALDMTWKVHTSVFKTSAEHILDEKSLAFTDNLHLDMNEQNYFLLMAWLVDEKKNLLWGDFTKIFFLTVMLADCVFSFFKLLFNVWKL